MKVTTCPYCNMSTDGRHEFGCPNSDYNSSNTPIINQPIGSTINFDVGKPSEKIGLKKYPKEPYAIFELPVRKNEKNYQVWTGKRWYKLEIKTLNK